MYVRLAPPNAACSVPPALLPCLLTHFFRFPPLLPRSLKSKDGTKNKEGSAHSSAGVAAAAGDADRWSVPSTSDTSTQVSPLAAAAAAQGKKWAPLQPQPDAAGQPSLTGPERAGLVSNQSGQAAFVPEGRASARKGSSQSGALAAGGSDGVERPSASGGLGRSTSARSGTGGGSKGSSPGKGWAAIFGGLRPSKPSSGGGGDGGSGHGDGPRESKGGAGDEASGRGGLQRTASGAAQGLGMSRSGAAAAGPAAGAGQGRGAPPPRVGNIISKVWPTRMSRWCVLWHGLLASAWARAWVELCSLLVFGGEGGCIAGHGRVAVLFARWCRSGSTSTLNARWLDTCVLSRACLRVASVALNATPGPQPP